MLEKNEHYEMTIDDIGESGEGIGRINGFIMFVEHAVPGDRIEVRVVKLKKQYGYGKLIRILSPSPDRVEPPCLLFGKCGGCGLQHLSYKAQLKYKQQKVASNLKRIGGFEDARVLPVIGMDTPFFYRNKAQFPVGLVSGHITCGFYQKRSHHIVPVRKCLIQHPATELILRAVERYMAENGIAPYNEMTHTGLARHVLIKTGFTTGDVMVCMVINGNRLPKSERLIAALKDIKGMSSLSLNSNKEKGNVILGTKTQLLWGKPTITDFIGELQFEISPLSFFQVNPVQTKILYEKVLALAQIEKTDIIVDAYCGIGSISLTMAPFARKVYGIEVVPEAIDDAKRNAERNGIQNAEFLVGQVETVLPELFQNGMKPDIIVVDPPRKGCEHLLLQTFIDARPGKIVYVSCDSATLARDLKILRQGGYEITSVQPVDCFPMTPHVECVVGMRWKDC